MTKDEFIELWFIGTEKEDIGSNFYNKHLCALGDLKDFTDWFFESNMGLGLEAIRELGLNNLPFALRVLVSDAGVGILMCNRDVELSSLEEALECGEGIDFNYGYEKYTKWEEGKNMKLELINVDMKKQDHEDILFDSVEKKRRKGKANVQKLDNLKLGDIDILLGEFNFKFSCPKTELQDPQALINKLSKSLHDKYEIDNKDIASFDRVLDLLCGSQAKLRFEGILDCLNNEELKALCVWLDMYVKNRTCKNYSNSKIAFAFEPHQTESTKNKMVDILVNYQMEETGQNFMSHFFKTIKMTVVPAWEWIKEYKDDKDGVNFTLNTSSYFYTLQDQVKQMKRRKKYNEPTHFPGDIFVNHICFNHELHMSLNNDNHTTTKKIVDDAVYMDKIKISGDLDASEVDVFIGKHALKIPAIENTCILNADPILLKVKNKLIEKNLFDVDELNTNADVLEALSGSKGFKRTRLIMDEMSVEEVDILINYVYAYGRVFGFHPKSVMLAIAVEMIDDKEEIDVVNYSAMYNSYNKTGIEYEGYTIVPSFYWLQKLNSFRR